MKTVIALILLEQNLLEQNLLEQNLFEQNLLEPINNELIPHISKSIAFGQLKIQFDPLCKNDPTFSECSNIALAILFLILFFLKVLM